MFGRDKKIKAHAEAVKRENLVLKERLSELEKGRLRAREAEIKNRSLERLIEINTFITNSLNKKEVLQRILSQIKKLLDCERSSILLVDREANQLRFAFLSREEEGKLLQDEGLGMGEGIAGTVWMNGNPVMINDAQNDPRFLSRVDKKSNVETRTILAVPLTVNGVIIGVIEAINKNDRIFTPFDLKILQYISTQSAIAIKNADLYDMAITDGMTRLFIHKYFRERLAEEWNRSYRNNRDLSLVMFDIDRFKDFNDTYGHQAGDRVIVELAKILKENSRSVDIPCRYGGEEFVIILPETSREQAMVVVERIRTVVEEKKIYHEDKTLTMTVSCGVATIPDLAPKSIDDFINMADRALYASKENGRNRVTYYTSR